MDESITITTLLANHHSSQFTNTASRKLQVQVQVQEQIEPRTRPKSEIKPSQRQRLSPERALQITNLYVRGVEDAFQTFQIRFSLLIRA
jgi:hypothetical protein